MQGIIVKLIGGLYTVKVNGERIECKARGKLRHLNESPVVGDYVSLNDDFILDIKKRKNKLLRPPIANVDQAILVFSATEPDISFALLDRLISIVTYEEIPIVLLITKIDLLTDIQLNKLKNKLKYYKKIFPVIYKGEDDLESFMHNKISVLAGQSGVGKSTLLNDLFGFKIQTQIISKALGRGKHTTRHIELIDVNGGMVADTAGFSALDLTMNEQMLAQSFEDFFELSHDCKYRGCLHLKEPGCKVKEEVENGNIPKSRYDNYVSFNLEIIRNKRY